MRSASLLKIGRGFAAAALLVVTSLTARHFVLAEKAPGAKPAAAGGDDVTPEERAANKAVRSSADKVLSDPAPEVALQGKWALEDKVLQRDFPSLCLDAKGTPWVAYIEHDGKADVLKLGRKTTASVENVMAVSESGIVHQPAIARDGSGALWCFWGQVDKDDIVRLNARRFADGKLGEPTILAKSAASDTFAHAGTDHAGRVWVVWQSMRRGQGDIFTRWLDPKTNKWSEEIAVSKPEGGNWEPRVAFDGKDGAWVVFDSSRAGDYNLYLAHVGLDGKVTEKQITSTPEYEARATIVGDGGKGLWIAAERGRKEWGMQRRGHADMPGHEDEIGLNAAKRILFGYYDIASGSFTEVPLLEGNAPGARTHSVVNLPDVTVDAEGNPWIAFRVFTLRHWRLNIVRLDAKRKTWSSPVEVPDSTFCQDRHAAWERDAQGGLWLCWPSDRRYTKACGISAVFLAQLDTKKTPPDAGAPGKVTMMPEPAPYFMPPSPDRPRNEHHTWTVGGKTYHLYYGDLHRHTDFSNCRTAYDSCVLEAFRYAVDMAALDFLGTSDHTDVGKKYDAYEWWQTQRLVDVFYAPGKFTSMYAYEREQKFPWGHRNVIFPQRGGPVVYIKRSLYKNSQWNPLFPCADGEAEITPMELWGILRAYGKPVSVISHTGATGMGTDWDKYERIDHQVENIVEIYQGARVSYEGLGLPQPTVGLKRDQPIDITYTPPGGKPPPEVKAGEPIKDFGDRYNHGVYQRSLSDGHQLGVFASSDHLSAHVSFGGVYVENFTRQAIIEGFNARRTIAATDKVFIEFSCNDQPMGTVFEVTKKPALTFAIFGTSTLKRVTIVRNETDFQVFEPGQREFHKTFTDEKPLAGENRYYLRVEQADGSMGWSSPVWVTVKK